MDRRRSSTGLTRSAPRAADPKISSITAAAPGTLVPRRARQAPASGPAADRKNQYGRGYRGLAPLRPGGGQKKRTRLWRLVLVFFLSFRAETGAVFSNSQVVMPVGFFPRGGRRKAPGRFSGRPVVLLSARGQEEDLDRRAIYGYRYADSHSPSRRVMRIQNHSSGSNWPVFQENTMAHKKIERKKELDRRRHRRAQRLKERKHQAQAEAAKK